MSKKLEKYFLTVISVSISGFLMAQAPAPYDQSTMQVNHIRVWNVLAPESNSGSINTATSSDKAQMTTQYFDGLGRIIQTVTKGGSMVSGSSQNDLVDASFYDDQGREQYKYLPFAANNTNGNPSINDGMLKYNPFQQQAVFSQSQYPDETYFYGHTKFENSFLNRPIETYVPGDSWVGTENSSKHGVKIQYWTNTVNDDVKTWSVSGYGISSNSYNLQVMVTDLGGGQQNVTCSWSTLSNAGTVLLLYRTDPNASWNSNAGSPVSPRSWTMPVGNYQYGIQIWFNDGTPVQTIVYSPLNTNFITSGPYSPGPLFKTVTEDERGKQSIEFKDKDGKVVLKKVQLTGTPDDGNGTGYAGWLCTYYIYDDLNQLRCVIQPEGVKTLADNGWNLMGYSSGILLAEQCFRYEYDERGRMIIKKVPGAGEVLMVYDRRDRLVFTQDANLRSNNQWIAILY